MNDQKEYVEVSISTTAGFYPEEGLDRTKAADQIQKELEKASHKLKIKSTAGWVATVSDASGKRTLDPSRSYLENGLVGQVEIDWGPSEGGGGEAFD